MRETERWRDRGEGGGGGGVEEKRIRKWNICMYVYYNTLWTFF